MKLISFSAAVLVCALAFGADEPSEQHRLAAELLKAMNHDRVIGEQLEWRQKYVRDLVEQLGANKEWSPELKRKTTAEALKLFAENLDSESVRGKYVQAYTDAFSANELRDLIAFYRSPAGQALVKKLPALAEKINAGQEEDWQEVEKRIIVLAVDAGRVTPQQEPAGAARGE